MSVADLQAAASAAAVAAASERTDLAGGLTLSSDGRFEVRIECRVDATSTVMVVLEEEQPMLV